MISSDLHAPSVSLDWPHRQHSRFVERGAIRWHVQTMGSGPAMLLLHGTGASSHSFRSLMPLLARRYTLIVPDLPGHAHSSAASSFRPTLPRMAAALGDLLSSLEVKPTIAVGHSAGAAVILRAILDGAMAPESAVGLAAALTPLRGVPGVVFPATARLLARSELVSQLLAVRAGYSAASVDRLLRRTGSSLDARGVELYRRLTQQPAHVAATLSMMASWDLEPLFAELGRIRTRVVLFAGERDLAVPLSEQHRAAGRIPGARVVVVSGAGHLLHEEKPAEVARRLEEHCALRGCD